MATEQSVIITYNGTNFSISGDTTFDLIKSEYAGTGLPNTEYKVPVTVTVNSQYPLRITFTFGMWSISNGSNSIFNGTTTLKYNVTCADLGINTSNTSNIGSTITIRLDSDKLKSSETYNFNVSWTHNSYKDQQGKLQPGNSSYTATKTVSISIPLYYTLPSISQITCVSTNIPGTIQQKVSLLSYNGTNNPINKYKITLQQKNGSTYSDKYTTEVTNTTFDITFKNKSDKSQYRIVAQAIGTVANTVSASKSEDIMSISSTPNVGRNTSSPVYIGEKITAEKLGLYLYYEDSARNKCKYETSAAIDPEVASHTTTQVNVTLTDAYGECSLSEPVKVKVPYMNMCTETNTWKSGYPLVYTSEGWKQSKKIFVCTGKNGNNCIWKEIKYSS